MNTENNNLGFKKNQRDSVYEILADPNASKGFFFKYAHIWMSRKCNSKCLHCYQNGNENSVGWPIEKASKVTDMLLREGFVINPIVNEWMPENWPYLRILQKCGIKEISTNGIIIVEKTDAFFDQLQMNGISDIRHTLFPHEIHENITGRNREAAILAIRLSQKHEFRNVVNYVVMKETLSHIPEFCLEMIDLGINEVQFMNYIPLNRAYNKKKWALSEKEIRSFWAQWEIITNSVKTKNIVFDFQANFGPNPYKKDSFSQVSKLKKFCLGGIWQHGKYLYITPEDKIFPCATLAEKKFQIGSLVKKGDDYIIALNDFDWEKQITGFDRSTCASLQYNLNND